MSIRCALTGHSAGTTHHHNQGLDFAICHHCGCDLIRAEGEEWGEVPKGFRVVRHAFVRNDDAFSVAARMQRLAPPPRRAPRNARPAQRRDPRSLPLRGAASMLGMFAGLGKLIESEPDDSAVSEAKSQYVICLPGGGAQ